jgi:glutamate formiminotransferase
MEGNPVGRVLSVPNFSEGRDYHFIRALQGAVKEAGATLHTISWDVDHNRTVVGLSGEAEPLAAAVLAMAELAVADIDLTQHQGVHPRIGALDVVPVVPTVPDAAEEANALVADLAPRLAALGGGIPVFLYGRSAREGRPAELPAIRRGQFEGWVGKELTGAHAPDFGPPHFHPTAGASVIGVRGPLTAFNVMLMDPFPEHARTIAAEMRRERTGRPELAGVQAMGVALQSRGLSQVSTNITDPEATGMADVFDYVWERAPHEATFCEVIGVVRASDVERARKAGLFDRIPVRLWPEQVLDY